MTFVIFGAPVTKKNSQRMAVNRRTGHRFPIPSKPYERWVRHAQVQARVQFFGAGRVKITRPCRLKATFYRKRAAGDLDNFLAALFDMLQLAGLVENDRLIASVNGTRLDKDAKRPRIEFELEVLGDRSHA